MMTATATATRKPKIRKTMCIAQPQLHDCDMKLPNFMRPLYGVGEHSTNFFLFLNLDTVLSFSKFWKSKLLLLLKQYRNIFKITYENGRSISIISSLTFSMYIKIITDTNNIIINPVQQTRDVVLWRSGSVNHSIRIQQHKLTQQHLL